MYSWNIFEIGRYQQYLLMLLLGHASVFYEISIHNYSFVSSTDSYTVETGAGENIEDKISVSSNGKLTNGTY